MDAFTKIFNKKDFLKNFNTLKPACLIMGGEAYEALREQIDSALLENYGNSFYTGYTGTFIGTKIYVVQDSSMSNKIIFGVE